MISFKQNEYNKIFNEIKKNLVLVDIQLMTCFFIICILTKNLQTHLEYILPLKNNLILCITLIFMVWKIKKHLVQERS